MSYPTTDCYICGNECKDWGTIGHKYLCLQCAIDVFNEEDPGRGTVYYSHKIDPMEGNGLGKQYDPLIEAVKARKGGKPGTVSVPIGARKIYSGQCPCGIHPQHFFWGCYLSYAWIEGMSVSEWNGK